MSWRTTLGLKPGKDEFAREVIALLRGEGVTGGIDYDHDGFRLVIAASGLLHYLHNHYAEVCGAWPWQRRAVSLRFIRSLVSERDRDEDRTLDQVRARLLPIIRDPLYVDALRLQFLKDKSTLPEIPAQPLAGFYRVSLAVDSASRMAMVNQGHLARWGIGFEEALALATHNLAAREEPPLERLAPGLFRSPWQDNYDPSRILLPQTLAGLGLRGDAVAMMPNRDCLLVADAADDTALGRLAELGRAGFDHPRSISAVPLVRQQEVWVPFTGVPGVGVGAKALAGLAFAGRGQAYADQKQHLEDLHHATGKDIFVASCSGFQTDKQSDARSYCVWAHDVETLLPRTELIALVDGRRAQAEQHLGLYRWEDLERVAGGLFRPVGMTPERWLTSGFPEAELVAGITRVR